MTLMKTQSNLYLFLIALISAMGGFLFGYDWVVIGGAKPFYEQYFQIAGNPVLQGWAMSSALIGCLIGALSAGKMSDRFGRKPVLTLAAGLFICTAIGTGAANSFTFFNVFRLVGGFAIGIASSLSPMYIAEIAPAHLRGRFVAINQLTVVLGILASQIVNWQIAEPVEIGATYEMIRESWNGQMGWRWMFWAMTVPAALFFIFSFILPESPRWLASSGRREAALKVFTRMGGSGYARRELEAIAVASSDKNRQGSFKQLLRPGMRKVLVIGVVMAVLQQWCGINVIFNYAQEIFMAGCRIWSIGCTDEYRCDRNYECRVYGSGHVRGRSLGTQGAYFDRGIRADCDLCLYGGSLLFSHYRGRVADYCRDCHCMLCHDVGYNHVGDYLRDLPQPGSWSGDVGLHFRLVGCLFHPYLYFPGIE